MENVVPDVKEGLNQANDEKANKLKEYENMFRILQKQRDYDKIKSLAEELETYDPGNKSAKKWLKKAENGISGGFWKKLFSKSKKTDDMSEKNIEKTETSPQSAEENQVVEPEAPSMATPSLAQEMVATKEEKPEMNPSASGSAPSISESMPSMEMASVSSMLIPEKQSTPEKTPLEPLAAPVNESVEAEKPITKVEPQKPKKEFNLLGFAKLFANFTVAFVVLTAGFIYVEFMDKNNTVLGLVGVENTGAKLHAAADELSQKEREVKALEKEIEKYKTGYQNPELKTIDAIMQKRINWPDVLFKIDEVTNSVYELNDFFKYIEYTDYAFDADRQTIRISGKLSDPQGNNLTKLVELENAFKFFPKDQNNPDDPTQPFFKGFKELTTLSKTLDQETGRYVSSFQLSFDLNAS